MYEKNIREELYKYFPQEIKKAFLEIKDTSINRAEEIRFRINMPLVIYTNDRRFFLTKQGEMADTPKNAITCPAEDIYNIYSSFTKHCAMVFGDQLKNAFITIEGGYRVGISGTGILHGNNVIGFKNISGINIRIPREVLGVSDKLLPFILKKGHVLNTLIISMPQMGKTTLIRDIARNLSGDEYRKKVCIIDERMEIAAVNEGIPGYDVGLHTDIINGINKGQGIQMAIRALSPDVVITDELGDVADAMAIGECINCGVSFVTTAHAASIKQLSYRGSFKKMIDRKYFSRYVLLGDSLGRATIEQIYDQDLKQLNSDAIALNGG